KGIRMREKRRVPEMFHYLGWCSWDAFYTEVSEEKIRQKADELVQKKVPVKWMIIDDGWLSARDELLYDFVPDKAKFPNGFKDMIKEIKEKRDFRWFGVWHALGGYWGGISQGSVLDCNENPYLYKTVNGKLVPSPLTGERFYRDWYQELRQEGIDFVKVDGQSAVPYYFENSLPVSEAARGMNQALESGASYMDGAIINCMGMAMENIMARPTSAISRNSDDFVPNKENGFAEHLLQNAYNAIYHNELYCCDWDMFWTKHEDSVKHSLLRAISGGPVYFSDKIGDTVPEVLKPLMYDDGRILMMDRSAKPTEDCIFSNPMEIGVLKLHNVASWGEYDKGGGIAAYNLTGQRQSYAFKPTDIPDIDVTDAYWVYDFFVKKVFCLKCNESYEGILEADGFAWFVILPKKKTGSCLGLLDKYAGFMAVESMLESDDTLIAVVAESGVLGWISEREPRQVTTGTADVTKNVQRDGNLYSVLLPKTSAKTVLTITL
ncbi:MAG: alpha-galactosidase, partial [Lachnospiraceae bacterium]|nr:alpha-galactosidase [Lachnospiraceae bacterium]